MSALGESSVEAAHTEAEELYKKAKAELETIKAAITKVVTQRGDDLCWRDVYTELAALVGVDPTPHLIIPPERMLANCCRFVESLRTGDRYIPVHVTSQKYARLHEKVRAWAKAKEEFGGVHDPAMDYHELMSKIEETEREIREIMRSEGN